MQLSLGERVSVLRRQRQLTQAQLATLAQCPAKYIYQLERGRIYSPGVERLTRLAQALGVTVEYLWTGTE